MKKTIARMSAVALSIGAAFSVASPAMAAPASSLESITGGMSSESSLESLRSSLGSLGSLLGKPSPAPAPKPAPKPAPNPTPAPKPSPGVVTPSPRYLADDVYNDTNVWRKQHGNLPQLKYNVNIYNDAQKWANHLAATGEFRHDPELATNPKFKYVYAENIYYMRGGDINSQRVVKGWENSAGHRDNMANPEWNMSAVGVAQSRDGGWYVVARYTSQERFDKFYK